MTERKRQIEELEAELRTRGASFYVGDDFDEEMRESFLRHVLAFEDEPETTHERDRLLPTAEDLRQQALHRREAATEA